MHRIGRCGWIVCSLVLLAVLAGCAGGPSAEEEARSAEWTWLSDTKQQLDAKRQELAGLKEQLAAAAPASEAGEQPVEGEEGLVEAPAADLEAQVTTLEDELVQLAEEFTTRLVKFLNADPMVEGEPPTERQLAALRMKSEEDMVLAREWIVKGGDYKRAIEIYNTALIFDPDNEGLKQALAQAEADRYMSEERLAMAQVGMTQDQIREVLGQVNQYNVKEYADQKVVAWFYPTSEDGSAAGVFFQPDKKSGEMVAYEIKLQAVTRESEEG